jgi:hypothetical protein
MQLYPQVKFNNCEIQHITGIQQKDRLCGLVIRVLGYRSGGPGSIPGTTRNKLVGLERGPLSLVSTIEELLNIKVEVRLENEYGRGDPSC